MKIKIIKESEANMWYNAHVGETFEVDERKTTEDYYTVKETFLRWVRHVFKSDCVVLNTENEEDR